MQDCSMTLIREKLRLQPFHDFKTNFLWEKAFFVCNKAKQNFMKQLCVSIFFILITNQVFSQYQKFTSDTDKFINQFVSNGLVDYESLLKDKSTIQSLTIQLADLDLNALSKREKEAVLINGYNITVLNQILDHYPINSPLDVEGFFKSNKFNFGGNEWTLDYLENEILRKEYMDARHHFALVCGAMGCPRLSSEAYDAEKLDEQLDNRTKLTLNSGWFLKENNAEVIGLSQIFEWFTEDFGGKKNLITWINLYRDEPIKSDIKTTFYPYDWTLNSQKLANSSETNASLNLEQKPNDVFNLQTFTGGSLLKKGQLDLTLFNTIYTQSKSNWAGQRFSGFRESFYTHSLQGTYGISKKGRFNIGGEINFKASAKSSDSTAASVTAPLDYMNNDSTRFGISNVGIRLRFQPFKEVSDFSIQSTFSIPTVKNAEGVSGDENPENNRYFLDWDRYVWWNQFFYSKSFSDFQIFTSVETLFRFGRNDQQSSSVDIPAKIFFSYFPTDKITAYVMTEHVPRFRYNSNVTEESIADQNTHSGFYTASGGGFKYQVGQQLNIELLYTNFWRSKYAGLGNTFNIGVKYIIN